MSSLGINGMNQLANKFVQMGWGEDRVAKLGQASPEFYKKLNALLDGRAEVTIKSRLTASTTIILPPVKKPKRLKDRQSVWLSDNVSALFNMVAKLPAAKGRTLERRDLIEPLNDFENIAELGGEDAAVNKSVAALEVAIGQLIDAGAGSSDLLADGRVNIFYVRDPENHERVLCVDVIWRGVEWYVYCDEALAVQWRAGSRVFRKVTVA